MTLLSLVGSAARSHSSAKAFDTDPFWVAIGRRLGRPCDTVRATRRQRCFAAPRRWPAERVPGRATPGPDVSV